MAKREDRKEEYLAHQTFNDGNVFFWGLVAVIVAITSIYLYNENPEVLVYLGYVIAGGVFIIIIMKLVGLANNELVKMRLRTQFLEQEKQKSLAIPNQVNTEGINAKARNIEAQNKLELAKQKQQKLYPDNSNSGLIIDQEIDHYLDGSKINLNDEKLVKKVTYAEGIMAGHISQETVTKIFLGYDWETREAVFHDFTKEGSWAVGGKTRIGKSTFVRAILSQLVMSREKFDFYFADPQANTFMDMAPKGAVAREPEEIKKLIEFVYDLADKRVKAFEKLGEESGEYIPTLARFNELTGSNLPYVVLSMDEVTGMFTTDETIGNYVSFLATTAAKAGVFLIMMAVDWKAEKGMSTTLRGQLDSRFQFGVRDRSIENILIPDTGSARIKVKGRAFGETGTHGRFYGQMVQLLDTVPIAIKKAFEANSPIIFNGASYAENIGSAGSDKNKAIAPVTGGFQPIKENMGRATLGYSIDWFSEKDNVTKEKVYQTVIMMFGELGEWPTAHSVFGRLGVARGGKRGAILQEIIHRAQADVEAILKVSKPM